MSVYSKLTRCIDINTRDDSITCFYVHNKSQANCLEISERGQTANVICYGYKGSYLGSLGIASGLFHFTISATQIAFTMLLRMGRHCSTSYGRKCLFFSQAMILIVILGLGILIPLVCILNYRNSADRNLIYADLPLRWVEYGVFVLTALCFAILVPSCVLVDTSDSTKNHHTDVVVLDV